MNRRIAPILVAAAGLALGPAPSIGQEAGADPTATVPDGDQPFSDPHLNRLCDSGELPPWAVAPVREAVGSLILLDDPDRGLDEMESRTTDCGPVLVVEVEEDPIPAGYLRLDGEVAVIVLRRTDRTILHASVVR